MRTRTRKEAVYKGIRVSPGIFIGKVTIIARPSVTVSTRKLRSDKAVEEEIQKFMAARDMFVKDLERGITTLPESILTVVQSQISILKDPNLEREVIAIIREERRPAEYAVNKVLQKLSRQLQRSESDYMRERAEEIKRMASDFVLRIQNSGHLQGHKVILRNRAIVTDDLSVQETLRSIRAGAKAFAFSAGGKTSHAGIIIRNYHLPAVFALGDEFISSVSTGDRVIVDGYTGVVIVHPKKATLLRYKGLRERYKLQEKKLLELKDKPAMTSDQVRLTLLANIDVPDELDLVKNYGAQGIGLFRTEYLFESYKLDEAIQTRIYRKVARQVYPGPLVIRLFDLGADKVFGREMKHPALGMRGIRVLLKDEKLLRTQIRAIIKANQQGNVKLMIPMVSLLEEVEAVKEILKQEYRQLKSNPVNKALQLPELGIMIETPSAALMSDILADHVNFFSIGTNDLTQYVLAVARGDAELAHMYNHLHPAVLRSIKWVCDNAHRKNVWVGVCGELASDPLGVPLLIGMRVDELSVAPGALLTTKNIINSVPYEEAKELVNKVMKLSTVDEVRDAVTSFLKKYVEEIVLEDGAYHEDKA